VYCDTSGIWEALISHFEDGSNQWSFWKSNTNTLRLYKATSGSIEIDINGGTLSTSTWYHVCISKIGSVTGIYIDGSQVAYDTSFTADTFSGSLYIGQQGGGTSYFDGRMDDIIIANQNIYDAAPNATNTDNLSNWNQAFVGVQ